MQVCMREWNRNRRNVRVFHRVCVCLGYLSVCTRIHLQAVHKGESRGAAPGIFFGHQMPVTAFRRRNKSGWWGGDKGEGGAGPGGRRGAPVFESCHVALIHPASLERGKGPEGLSQDRALAQTHSPTDICIHTLSWCFSCTYLHTDAISLPP